MILILIESDCLPPRRCMIPDARLGEVLELCGAAVYADSAPELKAIASALYRGCSESDAMAELIASPDFPAVVIPEHRPSKVVLFHYNPDRKG